MFLCVPCCKYVYPFSSRTALCAVLSVQAGVEGTIPSLATVRYWSGHDELAKLVALTCGKGACGINCA